MLDTQITAAQYAVMSEDLKREYMASGDGYSLQIRGATATETQLRAQLSTVVTDLNAARTEIIASEARAKTAGEVAAKDANDKLAATQERMATLQGSAEKAAVDAIIDGIANNYERPELFRGVLSTQVTATHDENGALVVSIVGADGKAITAEQLTKSFADNKDYAPMLKKGAADTTPTFTPAGGQQQQEQQQQNNQQQSIQGFGAGFNNQNAFAQQGNGAKMQKNADGTVSVLNAAAMSQQDWADLAKANETAAAK